MSFCSKTNIASAILLGALAAMPPVGLASETSAAIEPFEKEQLKSGVMMAPKKKSNAYRADLFASDNREDMFDGKILSEGDVLSLEIYIRGGTADTKKVDGGAGFILGNNRVAVFSHKKGVSLLVHSAEKTREYSIGSWGVTRKAISLKIQHKGDRLLWLTDDQDLSFYGEVNIESDSSLPIGVVQFPSTQKNRMYSVRGIVRDRLELDVSKSVLAIENPLTRHQYNSVSKTDQNNPAAEHLVLSSMTGALTKEEVQGIEKYLLEYPIPTHNHTNYYFRRRYVSYMAEWTYQKTGNADLVRKVLDVAFSAVKYRNDNYGQYTLSYGGVAPLWPNFKEVEFYEDGSTGVVPGAGVWGPIATLAVPTRIIANDSALWEQEYKEGMTFKQAALELVERTLESVDYTYDRFKENDHMLRYPEDLQREEWRDEVVIRNSPKITSRSHLAPGTMV